MNKKRMLILILFACFITGCLILSADLLVKQGRMNSTDHNRDIITKDDTLQMTPGPSTEKELHDNADKENLALKNKNQGGQRQKAADITAEQWITSSPSYTQIIAGLGQDSAKNITEDTVSQISGEGDSKQQLNNPQSVTYPNSNSQITGTLNAEGDKITEGSGHSTGSTYSTSINTIVEPQLILDCTKVDYLAYIPEMLYDEELEKVLDIKNPDLSVDATAAILFDADTMEVLYYKNPVKAVFPASTAKLLTALVALEWCKEEEEVTLGKEIKMIASDSTRAYLSVGQVLSIRNLLEGMLLPSGNDAAYGIAVYVGRKSLQNPGLSMEEALQEFIRLMNKKAKELGVKNSCFKTPDGYDAIGQYTTAYDMGLIGMAAARNNIIAEITELSSSRNIFVSGEDVTWTNTNRLISRYSGQYYSNAYGLKTGTSTMAGRCLVSAAERDGRTVVSVIMDSTSSGRWEDSIALLKYGLER